MPIREVKSKKSKKGITYRVYFDYKDKYGRPQHYSKSGFATKTEAINHEKLIYAKIIDGSLINDKRTFGDVWCEYIENDPHTSLSTKQIRKCYYNKHIKPVFEDADIKLLDYNIIQDFITEKGQTLAKSSVENITKVFSGVFKFAYNRNYIDRLPYTRLKLSGKAKNNLFKKKTVTENEFNELLSVVNKNRSVRYRSYKIVFMLGYYMGIRLSEALALEKSDVDFKNERVMITKNIFKNNELKELEIKEAKTPASCAVVPLPKILIPVLKKWFDENESNLAAPDNDMNLLDPQIVKTYLERYSKRSGVHISSHMFRHTFATRLWQQSVDIKIAQRLLRHENYQTTLDVYTSLENENLNNVVNSVYS